MHLFVYLRGTHGGFSFAYCGTKWAFSFHFAGVLHLSALAWTTRCLCTKKWDNPFHRQVFCNLSWSLDKKKGFLHFTPLVFYTFLSWLGPRGACAPKNGTTHFTTDVFCRTVFLSNKGGMNSMPPYYSFFPDANHQCRALSLS